ncbi:MAG: amidohydrolase family protein [SAR324 cluster bacterium]|nr:amidohydrolase family protein [SAR324 cluster bacterium]
MGKIHTILENAMIYDGSGAEPYKADLGISEDKIESIGPLQHAECEQRINTEGMAVAPGFIDLHTHSDFTIVVNGNAESQVHQGVTTEAVGQCGHSVAPLRHKDEIAREAIGYVSGSEGLNWQSFGEYLDHLEQMDLGVNVAAFVGHGTVHQTVMGNSLRVPDPEEVGQMANLVHEAMEQGAAGFSTGLESWPGSQASAEHIAPLCKVAADHDRLYATHVRNRDRYYDLGFGEAMATARIAGCRLQISHIQPKYGAPPHAMEHSLEMIESSKKYGLDVAFDIIPHDWSHIPVMMILPKWVLEGGDEKITERLKDPRQRERIKENKNPMWLLVADRVWSKIVLLYSKENSDLIGETFADIGKYRGVDPYDLVFDLLLEEGPGMHQLMWTSQSFLKSDLELCLGQSECAIISDTRALAPYGALADRLGSLSGYGWTSEFLSYYVKERNVLSLAEGIRRMTSLPAKRLGLRNRGLLQVGLQADIVVFDPNNVKSTWTVQKPRSYPKGFAHVFVNGKETIRQGQRLENNSGSVLRGPLS